MNYILIAAVAAAMAPSALLATPSSYDGKAVTVSGKVSHYQTTNTMRGKVAAFQLCDSKCVLVIDTKNTAHSDGDSVTVSGTYYVKFNGPQRSFDNCILIR